MARLWILCRFSDNYEIICSLKICFILKAYLIELLSHKCFLLTAFYIVDSWVSNLSISIQEVITSQPREFLWKSFFLCPTPRPRAKRTLNVPYGWLGECGGSESCTTGRPQKWANDKVEGLCRLYQQLTTEMGECGGWAQKAIKLIYCPWGVEGSG